MPEALCPRGWWPLLDAPLVLQRELPLGLRGRRPVVRFRPRGEPQPTSGGCSSSPAPARRDLRALVGRSVRATGLDALLEERHPYDGWRPGMLNDRIVAAVREASFNYMWSKSGFGEPQPLRRDGSFVLLPYLCRKLGRLIALLYGR